MRITLFLLFFSLALAVFGQENPEKKPRRTEIGLNITGTLAGFLNADGNNTSSDPFLLSIKRVGLKNTLRVGFNLKSSNKKEDTDGFVIRTSNENLFRARTGIEHRLTIAKRCIVHWGGDVIGEYAGNTVKSTNFGVGNATLTTRSFGVGTGPVLGFQYAIHPRITLSTEAALYAMGRFGRDTEQIDNFSPVIKNIRRLEVLPLIPSSLYINILF